MIKYIIAPDYWEGLKVVPIVMAAEILMGVYFNLSFWYKLTDQTMWGAVFSGIGCTVLILVNVIFVPIYGYMACAWGGVAGYGVAMILSYVIGQKKYPIAYPVKKILGYTILCVAIYSVMEFIKFINLGLQIAVNTALIFLFLVVVVKQEHFPFGKLIKRVK